MGTISSYIDRFVVILIFISAVSLANAATPGGRVIVIRMANFGWKLAANLKIDRQPVGNIV